MVEREPTVHDIDWFNDLLAFQRLDVEPPYQRYSVWSRGYQQYFIDTILSGFPSPTIVLHKDVLTSTDHVYRVVDGKQRLLAIFGFQNNEFPLDDDHDEFPGAYWEDLPEDVRIRFGNYRIAVETLTTKSEKDLREAFDRLNRNVRRLNRQELRHAKYDGPFMELIEGLAQESFWTKVGVSTPARMRRMRDIEFVSEVFLLTALGVQDGHWKVLDNSYARYDFEESFQEIEGCRALYEQCRAIMERLGTTFLRSTRFNNLHDFYSLWAAFLEHLRDRGSSDGIDYQATRGELEAFSERVTDPDSIAPGDEVALRYSDAVRQGANKLANRRRRSDILKGLIRSNAQ